MDTLAAFGIPRRAELAAVGRGAPRGALFAATVTGRRLGVVVVGIGVEARGEVWHRP